MRTTILLAVILVASALVAAQESGQYVNTKDGFKIYFFPLRPQSKTSRGSRSRTSSCPRACTR